MSSNVFLNQYSVETLSQKLQRKDYKSAIERNNLLLSLVHLLEPVSMYSLSKISGLSYATVKQVCRWFEASNLVYIRVAYGENGLPVKLIRVLKQLSPEEKLILSAQPTEVEDKDES